jgi:hypothetical protein
MQGPFDAIAHCVGYKIMMMMMIIPTYSLTEFRFMWNGVSEMLGTFWNTTATTIEETWRF